MSLEGVEVEGRWRQREREGEGRELINTCVMLRWKVLKLLVIFPRTVGCAELQLVLLLVNTVREQIL